MAGRNNPFINLLNISFDTFNLLHRWFGRIVVLQALAHTLAYALGSAHGSSWSATMASITVPGQMKFYGFIVSHRL